MTTANYNDMSNYTCNSYSGRSVCGSGFMGSSDGSGYSDLHYGNNEDVICTSIIRILIKFTFFKIFVFQTFFMKRNKEEKFSHRYEKYFPVSINIMY